MNWRLSRCWFYGLALGVVFVTTACGDLPRPFRPEVKNSALSPLAQLGDVSGVVVATIQNAPPGVGEGLADSVASLLRKANAPATTTGALTNGHLLQGRARIIDPAGDPVVVVDWRLTNPANVIIYRRATLIASAATVSPLLHDVGQNVGRDVTPEWPAWRRISRAAIGRASKEIADAVAGLLQSNTPFKKDLPRALLAVASVTGAPGDGNESLKRAFEAALRRAGLPVAATMRDATVLIYGEVSLQRQDDTAQLLDVTWSFRGPEGRDLGALSQHNRVQDSQVDARWGALAYDIALAAIDGVVRILRRRDEIDAITHR